MSLDISSSSNATDSINGHSIVVDDKPCPCGDSKEKSWTVSCCLCQRWYHAKCIELSDTMQKLIDEMVCNHCAIITRQESRFKKKCRLPECFEPTIDKESEFCSSKHKTLFWKRAVQSLNQNADDCRLVKWIARKFTPEDYQQFVDARQDGLMKDQVVSEKSHKELNSLCEMLQKAKQHREGSAQCCFDPMLIGIEGPVCSNSLKCVQHRGWIDMVNRKIKLYGESNAQRMAPDSAYVARRAKTLVMGTTRFSERHVHRAAYLIPYIWDEDDKDYYIHGNPESFWAREF